MESGTVHMIGLMWELDEPILILQMGKKVLFTFVIEHHDADNF